MRPVAASPIASDLLMRRIVTTPPGRIFFLAFYCLPYYFVRNDAGRFRGAVIDLQKTASPRGSHSNFSSRLKTSAIENLGSSGRAETVFVVRVVCGLTHELIKQIKPKFPTTTDIPFQKSNPRPVMHLTELKKKSVPELLKIAEEIGLDSLARSRKQDIFYHPQAPRPQW